MNEEAEMLINMALERRLTPAHAGLLMGKIHESGSATAAVLAPPHPATLPPDLRDFDMLFSLRGCPDLLASLPLRIKEGLETGDTLGALTALAMLDAAELAGRWERGEAPGYMFGAGNLEEREDGLHLKHCALHFSGESLAMRLFGYLFPARWPAGRSFLVREEEGRRVEAQCHPEPESIITRWGNYDACLKVTHRLTTYHLPFTPPEGEAGDTEHRTFWLAPGVGPVKAVYEGGGDVRFEVELTDGRIGTGGELLPSDTGNRWLFEGTSEGRPHRELWRSLAPDESGLHAFTVAAHPYSPPDGPGPED